VGRRLRATVFRVLGRHVVIRCTGTDVSDELMLPSSFLKNGAIRSTEELVPSAILHGVTFEYVMKI
jgi:hypothetical protein